MVDFVKSLYIDLYFFQLSVPIIVATIDFGLSLNKNVYAVLTDCIQPLIIVRLSDCINQRIVAVVAFYLIFHFWVF